METNGRIQFVRKTRTDTDINTGVRSHLYLGVEVAKLFLNLWKLGIL